MVLDAAHALRLSPVSSDWAVSGDREAKLGRAREELGWEPSMSSRESALVLLAQRGRLSGTPTGRRATRSPSECSRSRPVAPWGDRDAPGLAGFDLDATLRRLEHAWIEHRGERVHLEVHEAAHPWATVVYAHGLGDHARRSTFSAVPSRTRASHAVLIDRRGHGISEGGRGDATLEADLAVTELALAYARERFGSPVVLMGDSLGGIMSWYLLTREPDVEAVVCHCINHPEVHNDPSLRWKAPLTQALAKVAPTLRIPVDQIADYSQVALEPLTGRYFTERPDRLFNFRVTMRSVASYAAFEPRIPWERVTTPVLVTIGTRTGWSRANTPSAASSVRGHRGRPSCRSPVWATSCSSITWPGRCRRCSSGSSARWRGSPRRSPGAGDDARQPQPPPARGAGDPGRAWR